MEDDTELKHAPVANTDVNASGESDSGSYDDEDDEDDSGEYEYEEEDESWRRFYNHQCWQFIKLSTR